MTTFECPREQEVLDAVANGRWPTGGDGTLQAHADSCDICGDLVQVATALHEDAGRVVREARVPAAGLVWWRATIRARAEASRVAERPISVFQSIVAACAAGLACGLVGAAWRSLQWFQQLGEFISRLDAGRLELASASAAILQHAMPLVLGLGACLLLAPVALYLAFSDDSRD